MPQLILADGEIGIIIFLVVSFVSWIINMKNEGQKKVQRPRPNRQRQPQAAKRPDALKDELEMFLEEVTGNKPKQNNPQRPPLQRKEPRKRVEQRPSPAPRPAEVRQQQRPKPKPRPKRKAQAPPRPKPQKQPKRELGSTLREHVDDYMGENRVEEMAEGVSGRQPKRIGQSVKQHMGSSISGVPVQIEVDPPSATTARLVEMLRDPNSVRNAILINEILQPPRALRK